MNHQTHNKLVNFIWSIADENMHILVRDFRQGLRNHRQITAFESCRNIPQTPAQG